MRSRYSAYVLGNFDYLVETHENASSEERAAAVRWAKEVQWRGLEVVEVERGGPEDDEGIVEFKAHYVTRAGSGVHHERSSFRRVEGRWMYVNGVAGIVGRRGTGPKPGRNEACPCGSGKKYKKCCGK